MGCVRGGLAIGVFCAGMMLAGCRTTPGTGAAIKAEQMTYRVRGRIVAVDAAGGHVTLDAGAIPGLMAAMTMSYKLVDSTITSELHPGDTITATVLVDQDAAGPKNPRLDQVVVVGQASADTKPAVSYHVPAPGDHGARLSALEPEREGDSPGAVSWARGAVDVYLHALSVGGVLPAHERELCGDRQGADGG